MALSIKTKQSVEFDGKAYIPEVNTELRMRLGQLNVETDEDLEEAYEVIASCFPKDKEKVKGLLQQITTVDLQFIRAYLIGGEKTLEAVEKQLQAQFAIGMEQK